MIASPNVMEMLVKMRAAEALVTAGELRTGVASRDAICLLVEESVGLVPRSRLWKAIESLRILEERGGGYALKERLALRDFLGPGERPLPASLEDVSWSLDEMIRSASKSGFSNTRSPKSKKRRPLPRRNSPTARI